MERTAAVRRREVAYPLAVWAAVAAGAAALELVVWGTLSGRARWDAGVQLDIARSGWTRGFAWQFPGVPLALRAVHVLTRSWLAAGIVLSAAAGASVAVLFWRWLADHDVDGTARRSALWVLLLYPWGFWLVGVPATDGVFLALALGAFVVVARRPAWAAALAAAACAVRPTGVVLVAALCCVTPPAGASRWRRWVPLLGLSGLVAVAVTSWVRFGDPVLYVREQARITEGMVPGDPLTWPPVQFLTRVGELGYLGTGALLVVLAQAGLTVAATVALPAVQRRFGTPSTVWCAGILLLVWTGAWDFSSAGRYLMALFPLAALVGEGAADLPAAARWALGVVLAGCSAGLLLAFTGGAWYSNW